jgi:hypothetical protein
MVVVVGDHLHHSGRPPQPGGGTHEDPLRPRGDESVDQVLGQAQVDMTDAARRALALVATRVVQVGVEPVLM